MSSSNVNAETIKALIKNPTQELLVFLITIVFFVLFSVFINGFISRGNLFTLLNNVSVLGILSMGMAIVVIGRGIDLSQVAVMAISTAWAVFLMRSGVSVPIAILLGLLVVVGAGALNGLLIAFVEIPALFATLASGIFIFGLLRVILLKGEGYLYVPETCKGFLSLSQFKIMGIPLAILIFVVIAFVMHQFLSRTAYGRFIYAHGDTSDAARLSGIAIRPLTVLEYILCAVIGYIGGVTRVAMVAQIDLRVINSTLIFDVILVVVLGGVSLIGGRGSIWSVIVGTVLIGTLLNGMTMMNISGDVQNIIKGLVLLGAVIVDNRLHPRDEETARQGDI